MSYVYNDSNYATEPEDGERYDKGDFVYSQEIPSPSKEEIKKRQKTIQEQVKELNPTINSVLLSIGVADNKIFRIQLKALLAKLIKSYDPSSGLSIHTWVSRSLLPLNRMRRNIYGQGLPERTQLDLYAINKAKQDYIDSHDREPDILTLSDLTGIKIKRINKVLEQTSKDFTKDEHTETLLKHTLDYEEELIEGLYPDLDYNQRFVLEHITGYKGNKIFPAGMILKKLKISPSKVSQIKNKLTIDINNLIEEYREAYG